MKLSKLAIASLASAGEAYAGAYQPLAIDLANRIAASKTQTDKAKGTKQTVWDGFKSALAIAQENGHTETALRVGLEIACENAGIPSGSYRSYVVTVGNLFHDVKAGELTGEQVEAMTVKEARDRYKAPPSELEQMRAKLIEDTKDFTVEQFGLLLSIVSDVRGDADTAATDEAVTAEPEREAIAA